MAVGIGEGGALALRLVLGLEHHGAARRLGPGDQVVDVALSMESRHSTTSGPATSRPPVTQPKPPVGMSMSSTPYLALPQS